MQNFADRSTALPLFSAARQIRAFVKASLSPELILTEIEFLNEIPKTRSGKLLRRVLRTREMGLPIGEPLKIKDY